MALKVGFHTLGCKLNFSETATVARQFDDRGFEIVDFKNPADIYVVNTCSVTENADRKCKKVVKQALKNNPEAFIIVMGCYAQLKPQEIASIPGVDAVLGAAEKFMLFDLIHNFDKNKITTIHRCQIQETTEFVPSHTLENRTRAFLKVQDGCDYKCSFCTIPLARGLSRSIEPELILHEARKIESQGIREIVLTGVNIGDYGKNQTSKLIDLIQILDKELCQIDRIRISSIEPNLLSNEIIEFVAHSQRFVPHFHIPLQSGSDKILRLMRRRYLSDLYRNRVETIKSLMPNACIGCDVIVGFPGETIEDFKETINFIENLDISYLHVFPFSERNNTLAAEFEDHVPQNERYRRCEVLRLLSNKKRNSFNQQFIGKSVKVLFEHEIIDGSIFGYSENYIRVGVNLNKIFEGEIHNVRITDSLTYDQMSGIVIKLV